jgi:hypothetical protein
MAHDDLRLVKADYSQIELRLAAMIAPDKAMLTAFIKVAIMRRRYDPNQLELFPEFVTQDVPQDSKRSRGNPQRSGGRLQPPRSNPGLRTLMQLPLALGCGCRGREERSDAADVIEQKMPPARGDAIGDEAAVPGTSQV